MKIIGEHSMPAMKRVDELKRDFGGIRPIGGLSRFVSAEEGELYEEGKRRATRILFDAYAEVAIRQIRDPEAFIELLDAIQQMVATTLTMPSPDPARPKVILIDKYEVELCRLAWVETAWRQTKPNAIRILWQKWRAFCSGSALNGPLIAGPVGAEKTSAATPANLDVPQESPHVDPAEKTPPAQPATAKTTGKTADRKAIGQADFTARAVWLKDRLLERGWGNSNPSGYGGPDRKTIEKILRGEAVRNDVLDKLAGALSSGKHAKINVLDIPQS